METFDFPYHLFETEYPESGYRMQLGNAYTYASEPTGPDQRVITLSFAAMKYILAANVISTTLEPKVNMATLEAFYNRHKMWKSFIYPHPVYGNLTVKFNKPLKVPKGLPQGNGAVASFSIELIEMP